MQSRSLLALVLSSAVLSFGAGCNEDLLSKPEEVIGPMIGPRNCCAEEISAATLAEKVGAPADMGFFAGHAVYLGDYDGYRYVHFREMNDFWGFLGERDYKVPVSDRPMRQSMPLTDDAAYWQDVTWLGADGLPGVTQNPSLYMQPNFPLYAPPTATTLSATTAPAK